MHMIRLENVSKLFENKKIKTEAVKNVSLHINKGEIYGIIGFSGAGKSTLVRCINLLERPTSGKVYFENAELTELSNKELRNYRKKIGMIFQQFNLLAQRNVEDNIAYPLEILGTSKKDAQIRARELLKLIKMEDKAKAYPSQLSGGQKQRVAIARALATEPEVILCDEATSALDPITTKSILKLLKEINGTLGVTIVIITHEMKVIEQICDRVAVMNHGVIEEEAEVEKFFLNPKSDIGKKLLFGGDEKNSLKSEKEYIRIVFDGQSSDQTVFADLILESGVKLNLLGAETRDIDGRAYGQMLLEKPEKAACDSVIRYLEEKRMIYSLEGGTK